MHTHTLISANSFQPDLKGPRSLCQGSLQPPLDLAECSYLCHHVVNLMAQLRLPEDNVVEPLANVLAGVFLGSSRHLLPILHQPDGVPPQPLCAVPRWLGLPVVVLVGLVPVVRCVAGAQRRPVGGVEHGLGSDQVKILSLYRGGGWDSALVIVVGPPQVGTGIHGQGGLGVAIAGCHSRDSREEVAGLWPSVRGCQSGSNKLHVWLPSGCLWFSESSG